MARTHGRFLALGMLTLGAAMSWGWSAAALTFVPNVYTEQGRLLDSSGNPLTGTVSVVFTIYDAPTGGNVLWTQTQMLTLDSGYFSTTLGSTQDVLTQIPWTVFSGEERYLGIAVGTDPEMSPRQTIDSVPYALISENVIGDITPNQISITGSQAQIMLGDQYLSTNPNWFTYVYGGSYIIENPNNRALAIDVNGTTQVQTRATFPPHNQGQETITLGHMHENNGWDAIGFCGRATVGNTMCTGTNNSTFYWGYQTDAMTVSDVMTLSNTGNLHIFGALTQGSSRTLKKDIHYLDGAECNQALKVIEETPIATYRYKGASDDSKVVYGVIAEDTPAALTSDDGKALNISSSVGMLLASIKAQQSEIGEQQSEIGDLKVQLDAAKEENGALKARLDRLEEMMESLAKDHR
jgi:hypothetical protein